MVSTPQTAARSDADTALRVLFALSFCHFLNDSMQSLIPALYPMLKTSLQLDFGQIGLITFVYQITASFFQPLVGAFTDRRPLPYALAVGMGFTLSGLLLLSVASTFAMVLPAAAVVGLGSSVFHPESSRVARLASGGRHGFAQSLFQVGGNAGSAIGPLAAAFIVLPNGQGSVAWFALAVQLYISIQLNLARGGSVAFGVWMYFAFFTVTTNLLVALTLTVPAIAPSTRLGRFLARPSSITGATASIIIVAKTGRLIEMSEMNMDPLPRVSS